MVTFKEIPELNAEKKFMRSWYAETQAKIEAERCKMGLAGLDIDYFRSDTMYRLKKEDEFELAEKCRAMGLLEEKE